MTQKKEISFNPASPIQPNSIRFADFFRWKSHIESANSRFQLLTKAIDTYALGRLVGEL